MILVTGANGKTGRAVIAALAARGERVRAWIRRAENADALRTLGAGEVVVGSMADAALFARAATGVRAIYHICPNVSADEIIFGRNAIAAAKAAGVGRFVFHSVLHPQVEIMQHHWTKLRVEELLFESGLDWTILQPTAYTQNLLGVWREIEAGVYRTAYGAEARVCLVDLDDVAEVAAKVLTEDGHTGATYELVGTPAHSQAEVAQILGEALGRPVRVEAEPAGAWQARLQAAGMSAEESGKLVAMARYYQRHGLIGNANVLTWLLGRAPTSLADFARGVSGRA